MNLKANLIKLSKMLLQLKSVMAGDVELIYEGELAVGIEVFTLVDGEYASAPDGEYELENAVLVIAEGKVSEIRSTEPEPEPIPEVVVELPMEETPAEPEVVEPTVVEDKEAIIAELEERLAAKDEAIAVLDAKVKELEEALATKEEALQMSADKSAKEKIKELNKMALKKDSPLSNWGK